MKKKAIDVRSKMIVIRMNDIELERFEKLIKKTTARSVSEYARHVLLAKPVIVKFRNTTADAFLHELLALKRELSGIGNNFNQAVHALHLLSFIPEFREWIQKNDNLQKLLVNKIEEIRIRMNNIYDQLLEEKTPAKSPNDVDD